MDPLRALWRGEVTCWFLVARGWCPALYAGQRSGLGLPWESVFHRNQVRDSELTSEAGEVRKGSVTPFHFQFRGRAAPRRALKRTSQSSPFPDSSPPWTQRPSARRGRIGLSLSLLATAVPGMPSGPQTCLLYLQRQPYFTPCFLFSGFSQYAQLMWLAGQHLMEPGFQKI